MQSCNIDVERSGSSEFADVAKGASQLRDSVQATEAPSANDTASTSRGSSAPHKSPSSALSVGVIVGIVVAAVVVSVLFVLLAVFATRRLLAGRRRRKKYEQQQLPIDDDPSDKSPHRVVVVEPLRTPAPSVLEDVGTTTTGDDTTVGTTDDSAAGHTSEDALASSFTPETAAQHPEFSDADCIAVGEPPRPKNLRGPERAALPRDRPHALW